MKFNVKTLITNGDAAMLNTGALVIGLYESGKLAHVGGAQALSLENNADIAAAIDSGDITGKAGTTLVLRSVQGIAADRIVLVGLGAGGKIAEKSFSSAVASVLRVLSTLACEDALVALPFENVSGQDFTWVIRNTVLSGLTADYRTDSLKSKKDPEPSGVRAIDLLVWEGVADDANKALNFAQALNSGMVLTKDLGNLPANICTPTHLANQAMELWKYGVQVKVLDQKDIEELRMDSFLSVTAGSVEPPKFIILEHNKGGDAAPFVLVGKGITFDTGGISLKPGAAMDEMKYDMLGAASVIGTFRTIAELELPLNVIGVIPTCENMPSGTATRPGDIVTSMSGQTIEILNTDAEGRLILCDALTYVERFRPAAVVDIATLTGAILTALGHHNTGLFTREDEAHDKLAAELLAAGKESGDTAWRMPLQDVYQEQIKSNFADVANLGTGGAGSTTAACFLERFTKKYTWAHLDIAGTASKGKNATGRPVPLLVTWLMNHAK